LAPIVPASTSPAQDTPRAGSARIARVLQLDRAGDRIHCARKLDQHAITHHLDDAPVMFGDSWLKNLSTPGFERNQGAGLVPFHKAGVTDHIGGQNGGKATFHFGAPSGTN